MADGRAALLLEETAGPLYLRYALVTLGGERQILPALLLDDWGKEIRGLALYEWIRENGLYFPRAEVFGFDLDGQQRQYFLKELELEARYPCYAYTDPAAPPSAGALLEAVLWPDEQTETPRRMKRPALIERPLRDARVSWWRVDPAAVAFDFTRLEGTA